MTIKELAIEDFYGCRDSVVWDVLGFQEPYKKLTELRNRLLCIVSSEITSEKSLSLLKKIVNPLSIVYIRQDDEKSLSLLKK